MINQVTNLYSNVRAHWWWNIWQKSPERWCIPWISRWHTKISIWEFNLRTLLACQIKSIVMFFFSTSPKCNSSWRATGLTKVLYESQMHQWETSNCWFLQEHCRLQYCSWVYKWYNFKLYKSFNCMRGDTLFVIAMVSHPLPIYPQFTRISTLTVLIRNKWNLHT